MADGLDDLLQEALKDFGADVPSQDGARAPDAAPQEPAAPEPTAPQPAAPAPASAAPAAPEPTGLGAGLPGKKSAGAKSSKAKKAQAGKTATGVHAPKMPAQTQQLADELMKLLEESGLGGPPAPGSSGDPDIAALEGLLKGLEGLAGPELMKSLEGKEGMEPPEDLKALAEQISHPLATAMVGSAGAGPSSSAGGRKGKPAKATVAGLMQQTNKTVSQQHKQGKGSKAGQGAGAGGAGGALGGLFGALGDLGDLGKLTGEDGPDSTNFMVDFIMKNLLSKDVLYTPLKEIRDKYPPFLEAQAQDSAVTEADMERYRGQYAAIQEVCKQYETDPANFGRLVELIQEMQKFGDPPAAIVEDVGGTIDADLAADAAAEAAKGEGEGEGSKAGVKDDMTGFTPEELAALKLPPDLMKDLPPELQKECTIM